MTGHTPRIEDCQTNFHWKFEGHTPRIEDFPDMGFNKIKMTPFWTNRCAIDGAWPMGWVSVISTNGETFE